MPWKKSAFSIHRRLFSKSRESFWSIPKVTVGVFFLSVSSIVSGVVWISRKKFLVFESPGVLVKKCGKFFRDIQKHLQMSKRGKSHISSSLGRGNAYAWLLSRRGKKGQYAWLRCKQLKAQNRKRSCAAQYFRPFLLANEISCRKQIICFLAAGRS